MEIKITSRQCIDQLGQPRRFHYFLVVDPVESEGCCFENYGVRIAEEVGTVCTIPGITTSAERIDELLSLLVEHRVGPVGLADVVADWL